MRRLISKYFGADMVELIAHPPFIFFILSVIFSQVAINMLNIVLIFLVYFLTSSNFLVSLLFLCFLLPQISLSFVGGVFADSHNKKNILMYGNLLRAFLLVVLFLNPKSLLLIYIVSFVIAVITQFYIPAETPIIPQLVKYEKLTQANSLFGVALFGSIMIGYMLAGPSIQILGRSQVFLLVIGLFLFACFFLKFIPDTLGFQKKINSRNSIIEELKRTYMLLQNSKEVFVTFLLLGVSQIVILILATVVPGYAKTVLEVTEGEISLVLFAPAALGMIASSFLIGRVFLRYNRQKLINIGVFLSGTVLCFLPLTSRVAAKLLVQVVGTISFGIIHASAIHFAVILSFFAGFANALIFVPSQTIIQESIPETFRSKIYGLLFSITGIMSLLPILIAGGIADFVGVGKVLFGIGGTIVLLGIVKARSWR